jgi:hypothetical protein
MIRFIYGAVITACVLACGSSVGVGDTNSVASRTVGDSLSLDVAVSSATMRPGDTAQVTVRVTNLRPRDVVLNFGSGCQVMFAVEDSAGSSVGPEWLCSAVLTSLRLAPGASSTRTIPWETVTFSYQPTTRHPLPAGTYRVYAELEVAGRPRSNPVVVALTAP